LTEQSIGSIVDLRLFMTLGIAYFAGTIYVLRSTFYR